MRKKINKTDSPGSGPENKDNILKEGEARYSALFENNPIQTVVVDRSGHVIAFNKQKRNSGDRLPRIGDIMYRDYASAHERDMYSELMNCINTGKMGEFPEQKYRGKILNIKIAPFDGGAIITSIDITDTKKVEYELLRIRKAVESTSEAIGVFDSSGRNYFQNKAFHELFGFTSKELAGFEDSPPLYKDKKLAHKIFNTVIAGNSWSGELDVVSKSGREFIVQFHADAIKDDNGEIIGLVGVHTDITEQKRLEEESRRLQTQVLHAQKLESLGILAGSIAHDFNNLLLGILGNADLALLELSSGSPAKKNIMDIISISRRAAELCRQMLAYSGKGKFIIEPVNLSGLVYEIGHLLEISICKKAELRYNLKEDIPAFNADATQIRQVIMNLITNASDALGGKKGIISIATGIKECSCEYLQKTFFKDRLADGIYVFLEVSDTGSGMDKNTVERIFDPFFSTKVSGRGLGLAAVMGIIRSHKGACEVNSEPGSGTSFRILFPVSENNSTGLLR